MTTDALPPTDAATAADAPQLTDSQAAVLGALLAHPGTTTAELSQVSKVSASATAKALAVLAGLGIAERTAHEPLDGKRVAATWQITADISATNAEADQPQHDVAPTADPVPTEGIPVAAAEPPSGRLGPGELRRLVAAQLAERPDTDFTPTMLSRLLGRSAGATRNCLDRLVADGTAQLVNDRPVRFRHAAPALVDSADQA